jgi:hypothetical protein
LVRDKEVITRQEMQKAAVCLREYSEYIYLNSKKKKTDKMVTTRFEMPKVAGCPPKYILYLYRSPVAKSQ